MLDPLTEEQFKDVARLGVLDARDLWVIRLRRVFLWRWPQIAAEMGVTPAKAQQCYDVARQRMEEGLAAVTAANVLHHQTSRAGQFEELLELMHGPQRHNPASPPLSRDPYKSMPGKPAYTHRPLRGKFPNGEALAELERNPAAGLPVRRA
jgi:hypothetical protein